MAHLRTGIRAAVIAKLITDVSDVNQRVFGNRAKRIFATELPCIIVYTRNEPTEISTEAPREYRRNLVIAIEILASAVDGMDDALDALCESVETSMMAEETFGGLVTDTILGETEMDIIEDGEKPVGVAKINFTMPYYQYMPGDLTAPLDDLEEVHVTIDVEPASLLEPATVDAIDVST